MRANFNHFLCFFALISLGVCSLGFDFAGAYQTSTLECLKNQSLSFVIVRGFHSYGSIDKAAAQTLINAKSIGLETDIYMFPCRGKDAAAQVDELIQGLNQTLYDKIWIDVESNPSSGCSWNGRDPNTNCDFVMQLINRLQFYKKKIGIYSTGYFWQLIFGNRLACPSASIASLWYAHYDKLESFDDYVQFGGWTTPEMKQFAGDLTVCGVDIDKNYKP